MAAVLVSAGCELTITACSNLAPVAPTSTHTHPTNGYPGARLSTDYAHSADLDLKTAMALSESLRDPVPQASTALSTSSLETLRADIKALNGMLARPPGSGHHKLASHLAKLTVARSLLQQTIQGLGWGEMSAADNSRLSVLIEINDNLTATMDMYDKYQKSYPGIHDEQGSARQADELAPDAPVAAVDDAGSGDNVLQLIVKLWKGGAGVRQEALAALTKKIGVDPGDIIDCGGLHSLIALFDECR